MYRRPFLLLLTLAALTGSARGGVVIETPTVVFTDRGVSGWFDVNVRYVPDVVNPPYTVAGYLVSIAIVGPDVVFTGVDQSTAAPYVLDFPGSTNGGLTVLDPVPIPPGGTTTLTFYDSTSPPDFPGRTMNANDVYGLGRVYFTVSPTAAYGDRLIVIDPPAPFGISDLTNSAGVSIISGVSGGTLSVVPEPSVLVLSLTCGLAGSLRLALRRLKTAA